MNFILYYILELVSKSLLKKYMNSLVDKKNIRIFAMRLALGALAHLARALDWQSKGDEFESRMLHILKRIRLCKSFFLLCSLFCFFSYLCASE